MFQTMNNAGFDEDIEIDASNAFRYIKFVLKNCTLECALRIKDMEALRKLSLFKVYI